MKEIILAIIGSGALSALISGGLTAWANRQQKENGVQAGVRLLMYDRIKHLGKSYIAAGHVSHDDLEDLIAMHKCYHDDLKGNGYLDRLMSAVLALPVAGTKE